jgi:dephospho-CoA kinase
MLIGLTGQIGAGKTAVAEILSKFGATIIDADQIGRDILEKNRSVKRELVRAFGKQVVDSRGRIDRQALATVAFVDERSRRKLNRIVHPHLLAELHRQTKAHHKTGKTVVIDAALLLEWKLDRTVDTVIAVLAPATIRLRRMNKRGFAESDIRRRMRLQLPATEFRRRSDIQISNNGSRAELRQRVIAAWKLLHTSK